MLFQNYEPLTNFMAYLPTIIYLCLYVAMLIFGYLIRKKNSYTYGLFFMISAIFSIVSSIIFLASNYPFLGDYLFVKLGLPVTTVMIIFLIVSFLFIGLNVTSTVFLLLAIYKLYKTHTN
ncbi:MAG: hypothetical protein V3V33_10715 [Candidatus Lokiarchaeia archaeon]